MNIDLTITCIARNEAKRLGTTLKSIQEQDYTNWECIVLIGESTDNTEEIAKTFSQSDNRFKVVRQKSSGISSAFNEAIQQASSGSVIFLNGGDLFATSRSLKFIAMNARRNPNDILTFKTQYILEDGSLTNRYHPKTSRGELDIHRHCSFAHPGSCIPLSVFEKIGGYSPAFRIAMDYEFWLRAIHHKYKVRLIDEVATLHRLGGISTTNLNRARTETFAAQLLWSKLKFLPIANTIAKIFVALTLGQRRF